MIASPDLPRARVLAVHVGGIAPLGPNGVPSGYLKRRAGHPVVAGELGLAGDAQADLRVHGGSDKAVYAFAQSRYAAWAAAFPEIAARFVAGAMGENLPLDGVDEDAQHIGDRIRVGGALLQVTQPRQPCFKLELALDRPGLVKAMIRNGWCGWYYRVLEGGAIGAHDAHVTVERPNPAWPVSRFASVIAARAFGADVLREMVAMEGLAHQWQAKALKHLAALRPGAP